MNEPERVVISGLGVVSSIGIGAEAFTAGLRAGRDGAKPITSFDTAGFERGIGTEIPGFTAADWLRVLDPATVGRAAQLSAAAARLAVRDGDLSDRHLRRRTLVSVGTTDGESQDLDALAAQQVHRGIEQVDPRLAGRVSAGRLTASIVAELGLDDVEAVTIGTACAAGNYAIGSGVDAIRAGDVDLALCGGVDAMCRKTFAGFHRLGAVSPDRCRPFDRDRAGILPGEGAAILVLESLASARARGARIHAEVLGYGLNCDARSPVAPDKATLADCMRLAHADAGVQPADIDFVSAHGTGTRANDLTEAGAIRDVFDVPPPVVSIKSMLGHTMGAAGALAVAAGALAITNGFIPPTINHRETDPECDVDCVPNTARAGRVDVVQNNALAFGGNNCVVVLGRLK
ncbi:beta-ketoacyl-[acyl-carrier-protein] synthase family protein [Amycolatopsis sp. A133]|uniref:beta-ketoacyl-[acyl-carrier-protein] synthase family protein n=1 Tax=Amycolatopsis sp. A133 TaxID=3064472 RepID=UPI0027ECAFA5|nr:beta-ketoacyl-[acyl-carrier-protein] synthase family protein [Amycolatopsis sp. A133]MDQ7807622.1 beta-ketoacyl-[acyl-carrier-protein] synthase family protein [Amycolatopsis sp. A133]